MLDGKLGEWVFTVVILALSSQPTLAAPAAEPAREAAAPTQPATRSSNVVGKPQPGRAKGFEVRAISDPVWRLPPRGGKREVQVGFTIDNGTADDVLVDLFDTMKIALTTAEGKPVRVSYGRDATRRVEPVLVPAGKAVEVLYSARLSLAPDGRTLEAFIRDLTGGVWAIEGLTPGRYTLNFTMKNAKANGPGGKALWTGEVKATSAEFEFTDAPESASIDSGQ